MSKILLSLDTLVVRPRISIDGKHYEIVSPDELPVLTNHMLGSKGKRMEELMKSASLSKAEKDELTAIVLDISEAVMEPVPAEIRKKLSGTHRTYVIEAFSALLWKKKMGTAAALTAAVSSKEEPTIGERPSRGSSASTEGTQDGGSKKRRSRS